MLEQAMVDSVYNSAVGLDALYVDASGGETPLRVLRVRESEDLLQAGDLAARGVRVAIRVRKCQCQNKPRRGDAFIVDSTHYVVDESEDYSATEWVSYVNP